MVQSGSIRCLDWILERWPYRARSSRCSCIRCQQRPLVDLGDGQVEIETRQSDRPARTRRNRIMGPCAFGIARGYGPRRNGAMPVIVSSPAVSAAVYTGFTAIPSGVSHIGLVAGAAPDAPAREAVSRAILVKSGIMVMVEPDWLVRR